MKKQNQDKIFLKLEGNKYFRRNGAKENKFILNAVKLLTPSSNSSIRHALKIIQKNSERICFVINKDNSLNASLSDGDIRNAIFL